MIPPSKKQISKAVKTLEGMIEKYKGERGALAKVVLYRHAKEELEKEPK